MKTKIIKPQLKDAEIETMALALVLLFAVSENVLCLVLCHRSSFFALLVIFITAFLAFCSVLIDLFFSPLLSLSPTRLIFIRRVDVLFLVRLHY